VSLFNNTYLAQYGCTTATFASCPTYIRSGSYGQTTIASPNLDPEKSRSYTLGAVFKPIRNITITLDYYNIKKTGAITQPSNAPALLAYYQGQAIPAGYTVVADAPDPNFPNAKPRVGFVQAQLVNANTNQVEGLDMSATASFEIGSNIKVTSSADASLILKLSTIFPDGTVERYDGTLGNFNLTAGSGTPKWHGSWLNTVEFGDNFQLNGTVNYFGGYDLSAQDQGTGYKDCGLSDGSVPCRVKAYITFDLNTTVKVTKDFSFYVNVLNVLNKFPPLDPVTYGAHLYNPVQGGNGILGRYFKAGVKFGF
jgi:iron complex outermembrane recepter protein